jgi:tetratricopeptide (TPR) repeat protein
LRKGGGFLRRSWLAGLSFLLIAGVSQAQQAPAGSSLDDVFLWLAGGLSSARIQRLAGMNLESADKGTTHPKCHLTSACVRALQNAGADASLIQKLGANTGWPGVTQRKSTVALQAPACATCDGTSQMARVAALVQSKNLDSAEDRVRALLRKDPENARLLFVLGTVLRSLERYDDALEAFTESVRLEPGFPETHNQLSFLFYRTNESDDALAEARTALSMDPANAEAYRYLGLALYLDSHYDAALNAFEKSLEREPENADVYFDIGLTEREQGRLRQAAVAYSHALKLRPDFWQAHSNLGVVLHDMGKLDESVAEYRAALRLQPDEPSIHNNLGNALCDKEDFDDAVAEFKSLLKTNPGWDGGHNCLARAYMSKHDYPAAILELQEAIAVNPAGATEHRVLGQALLLSGKDREAVAELRKAVELDPDSPLAHHYLGTALVNTQQLGEAEGEFRTALRLERSAKNHYALAACLMALDRYEEALGELEIASRMDPKENLYRARMQEAARMITTSK